MRTWRVVQNFWTIRVRSSSCENGHFISLGETIDGIFKQHQCKLQKCVRDHVHFLDASQCTRINFILNGFIKNPHYSLQSKAKSKAILAFFLQQRPEAIGWAKLLVNQPKRPSEGDQELVIHAIDSSRRIYRRIK